MVKLAEASVADATPLPPLYFQLFRAWFILGWPAFAGAVGIYFLMVAKPVF